MVNDHEPNCNLCKYVCAEDLQLAHNAQYSFRLGPACTYVEARQLEHGCPPTPNQRKKRQLQESSYLHVPTFWSLQYIYTLSFIYIPNIPLKEALKTRT